jgi:hypothetical protein
LFALCAQACHYSPLYRYYHKNKDTYQLEINVDTVEKVKIPGLALFGLFDLVLIPHSTDDFTVSSGTKKFKRYSKSDIQTVRSFLFRVFGSYQPVVV